MKKRILALLLTFVLLFSLLPTPAFAEEEQAAEEPEQTEIAAELPEEAPTDEPEQSEENPEDEPEESEEEPTDEPEQSEENPTDEPEESEENPTDEPEESEENPTDEPEQSEENPEDEPEESEEEPTDEPEQSEENPEDEPEESEENPEDEPEQSEEEPEESEENIVASGTCGENLTWTLDSEGLLTISGTGEMGEYDAFNRVPWYTYIKSIVSAVIKPGVTSIGGFAFEGCSSLTSISISEGVNSIGNYAFSNCSSLTSVIIPDSVTIIGSSAFAFCSSLTSIGIPEGLNSISWYVFRSCSSLTEINVAAENSSYCSVDGVLFNKSMTTLLSYPAGKPETAYSIPEGVTSIGESAFESCSNLTSISIPEGVTNIDYFAFSGCSSLTSISIPDSVESIGGDAFQGCNNLTSISISGGVTSIGSGAFAHCSSLTEISVAEENSSYCSVDGVLFNKSRTTLLSYPAGKPETAYSVPEGVTSIDWYAFQGCNNLTSVSLAESVTSIDFAAFDRCSNLTSVSIPDSVTSIGECAFYECRSLTSISIPEGVTSIGWDTFLGCSSLTSITIPESVTSIGWGAFLYCSSLTSITFKGNAPEFGDNRGKEIFDGVTATAYYPANDETWTEEVLQGYGGDITWKINDGAEESIVASGICGENLTWTLDRDGLLTISGMGAMSDYSYNNKAGWTSYGVSTAVIETGVTSIGNYAFNECRNMQSIDIPDSVTSIGDRAFGFCFSLKDITIPESVTSIGISAFFFSALKSITIPQAVTSIGDMTFAYCRSLTEVNVASDNANYSSDDGVLFNKSKTELLCYPAAKEQTAYSAPDSVTSIGYGAFWACSSLTSITIPKGVTGVGAYAFLACSNLTDITLPDSVASIGEYAFNACSSLTSITLPAGVKSISNHLFSECSSLKVVTIPNAVASIGDSAFSDCSSLEKIIFAGNAPVFAANAFAGVAAVVSYHADDDTWTEEVRQSYGGEITWEAVDTVAAKQDFVTRLYDVCLGREPSEEDLANSVTQLESGTTGAEKAYQFIFSDEFKSMNYCDEHYVIALYNAFMGREPAEEEIANWVWRMQQGDSREEVFNFFANGTEFGNVFCSTAGIEQGSADYSGDTRQGGYCSVPGCTAHTKKNEFAVRLYNVCLDRAPGEDEEAAWHYNFVHGEHTGSSASEFFLTSEEFEAHGYNNSDFVEHVFSAMLDRAPSESELSSWEYNMWANNKTRVDVIREFTQFDEFKAICQEYGIVHS